MFLNLIFFAGQLAFQGKDSQIKPMEDAEMSFGSIFSGEYPYVLRQSSNHSSVVKITCTYLEKRKREKKGGKC